MTLKQNCSGSTDRIPQEPPMKFPNLPAALLALATLIAPPTRAGEGHDHGAAAPVAVGQALPRFSAVSETFELVGVLNGKQITLYLDRYADNSPVPGAQIELEIGGVKFKAQPSKGSLGESEYEVVLPQAPKEGVLPITVLVTAGNDIDLLAGELDIHDQAHTEATAASSTWKSYAIGAAGGVAALALLLWCGRRWTGTRAVRARGAA
jgi:hypothetical protein